LNGNNLELSERLFFEKHDDSLSFEYFVQDLTKIRDILNSGTKNEVLEIIDPNHSIWVHYSGITGGVGWYEIDRLSSSTEPIIWIDSTTFDFPDNACSPLKLVP